jgi:phosphotransacetylase
MPEGEFKKIREMGSFSDYIDGQLKGAISFMSKIKSSKKFNQLIDTYQKERKEKTTEEEVEEFLNN